MQLKPEDISKIIKSQIKNYDSRIECAETGTVILVGDGIAAPTAGKVHGERAGGV